MRSSFGEDCAQTSSAEVSVDLDRKRVLGARREFRRKEDPARRVVEAKDHGCGVVGRAARQGGADVRENGTDPPARHVGRELVRVRSDIAEDVARAAACRVETPLQPGGHALGLRLDAGSERALHVGDVHQVNGAQFPRRNGGTGLPDHGIAGVVVGQAEHALNVPHPPREVDPARQVVGERLSQMTSSPASRASTANA